MADSAMVMMGRGRGQGWSWPIAASSRDELSVAYRVVIVNEHNRGIVGNGIYVN